VGKLPPCIWNTTTTVHASQQLVSLGWLVEPQKLFFFLKFWKNLELDSYHVQLLLSSSFPFQLLTHFSTRTPMMIPHHILTLFYLSPIHLVVFIIGIAYQGKEDIVFRFIIVGLFFYNIYEDFWKMIFWLVLELEINYIVMISWRILVSIRGFLFDDYIFGWWNIWIFITLLLP